MSYSIRLLLSAGVYDFAVACQVTAKAYLAMFGDIAIFRSSSADPIPECFTQYKDFGVHYECDCGCVVGTSSANGQFYLEEKCDGNQCCDGLACAAHPNFFTKEFVWLHGRKIYLS